MKKILLHTCCAPCFSSVFERLSQEYAITIFFCNPNIAPTAEYQRRFDELKNYPPSANIEIIEDKGDSFKPLTSETTKSILENLVNSTNLPPIKQHEVLPEGGERCAHCIQFRLRQTAQFAANNGFDLFATTLTVSPHKNANLINEIGINLSNEFAIPYLESNFKKQNGYLRSLELSKIHSLYRQNYCGCTPR